MTTLQIQLLHQVVIGLWQEVIKRHQLILKKSDLLVDPGFPGVVLIIASAFHVCLESDSQGIDLVSSGTSWRGPEAWHIQRSLDTRVSSCLHIQESVGFPEVEFFFLDQVFHQITFIQLVVSTEAVSCVHYMCLMLLIRDLISQGFELEWIGHMGLLEGLMGI